jgi:hypothetical protein
MTTSREGADPHTIRDDLSWAALCDQLVAEFSGLSEQDVIGEVARARLATELFGLSVSEQLATAGTIARNNLALLAGEVADLARLDPERHAPRRSGED